MTDNTRFEILSSLPAYGPMYIPVTDNDEPFFSEGFVIRFYKSDGSDWVGNFKPGWTGQNKVFDFPLHNIIVVVAGGLGYIMTPDNVKPLDTFGIGIDEIYQTENGSLVCADGISIILLDNQSGEIWRSEQISWDGFKDLKLLSDNVFGLSFDPTNSLIPWTEFSVNLKSKEIIGGSFRNSALLNPNIFKDHQLDPNQNKSWWIKGK
jgi:hypothetical protein